MEEQPAAEEKLFNVTPPRWTLLDQGAGQDRLEHPEQGRVPMALRCDIPDEGGMYLWLDGYLFPKKGVPYEGLTRADDVVKRSALCAIRFLGSSPMRYLAALYFLIPGRRIMNEFLKEYSEFTDRVLRDFYPQPKFCCVMVRELHRVFATMDLDDSWKKLATAFCIFMEADDAYRYRMQNFFELIDKDTFRQDPAKELKRVVATVASWEGDTTMPVKWAKMGKFLSVLFMDKSLKEFVMKFIEEADLSKLALDYADWYHVLTWNGFNFRGLKTSERLIIREQINESVRNGTTSVEDHLGYDSARLSALRTASAV